VLEQLYLIGLLAKKNKGKYFLRIEDTDKERSKDEFKNKLFHH
jgi:glutamyl/glutaminyl-tRNA synthetase